MNDKTFTYGFCDNCAPRVEALVKQVEEQLKAEPDPCTGLSRETIAESRLAFSDANYVPMGALRIELEYMALKHECDWVKSQRDEAIQLLRNYTKGPTPHICPDFTCKQFFHAVQVFLAKLDAEEEEA